MKMYEKFTLYVSPDTLIALRDILAGHLPVWSMSNKAEAGLIGVWGELESRVQHLPDGVCDVPSEENWLGE